MFTKYFASGARHFLAYDGDTLVSHAVVSTRGVQPDGLPVLRTAFVDAVTGDLEPRQRHMSRRLARRVLVGRLPLDEERQLGVGLQALDAELLPEELGAVGTVPVALD